MKSDLRQTESLRSLALLSLILCTAAQNCLTFDHGKVPYVGLERSGGEWPSSFQESRDHNYMMVSKHSASDSSRKSIEVCRDLGFAAKFPKYISEGFVKASMDEEIISSVRIYGPLFRHNPYVQECYILEMNR